MSVPAEAYEQLLMPHWNLTGFSDSKGLCLSSLLKETASAHYLQTASVTFLCQWMLIVLKEHCTNVQTAVCWERTAIISIFHLKAAITAKKAWATWLYWIWGTFTEAFTLSERQETKREGIDSFNAASVLLNTLGNPGKCRKRVLVAILVEKEDPRRSHLLFHVDLLKELLLTAASETHMPLGCIKDLLQHKLPQSADSVTYRALEAPGPVKSVGTEYIISFLRSGQGIFAVPCVPISKHSRHMEVTGRWDAGSSLHPSTYLVTLANITLLASSAATSPSTTLIANCNVGASRYLPIRGSIPASQTIPSPGLYNGQHAGLWWDWECLAQADFSWSPTSNICLYQVGNSG